MSDQDNQQYLFGEGTNQDTPARIRVRDLIKEWNERYHAAANSKEKGRIVDTIIDAIGEKNFFRRTKDGKITNVSRTKIKTHVQTKFSHKKGHVAEPRAHRIAAKEKPADKQPSQARLEFEREEAAREEATLQELQRRKAERLYVFERYEAERREAAAFAKNESLATVEFERHEDSRQHQQGSLGASFNRNVARVPTVALPAQGGSEMFRSESKLPDLEEISQQSSSPPSTSTKGSVTDDFGGRAATLSPIPFDERKLAPITTIPLDQNPQAVSGEIRGLAESTSNRESSGRATVPQHAFGRTFLEPPPTTEPTSNRESSSQATVPQEEFGRPTNVGNIIPSQDPVPLSGGAQLPNTHTPFLQGRPVVNCLLPPRLPLRDCHVDSAKLSVQVQHSRTGPVNSFAAELKCICHLCGQDFTVYGFERDIECPYCFPRNGSLHYGPATGGHNGGSGHGPPGWNGFPGQSGGSGYPGGYPPNSSHWGGPSFNYSRRGNYDNRGGPPYGRMVADPKDDADVKLEPVDAPSSKPDKLQGSKTDVSLPFASSSAITSMVQGLPWNDFSEPMSQQMRESLLKQWMVSQHYVTAPPTTEVAYQHVVDAGGYHNKSLQYPGADKIPAPAADPLLSLLAATKVIGTKMFPESTTSNDALKVAHEISGDDWQHGETMATSSMEQLLACPASSNDIVILESKAVGESELNERDSQTMEDDDASPSASISSISTSSSSNESNSHSSNNEMDSAKRQFSAMRLSETLDETTEKLKLQHAVVGAQQLAVVPLEEPNAEAKDDTDDADMIIPQGITDKYKAIQTLEGHSKEIKCCAMWNDGQNLLSGSNDKTLKVWERQTDGQYHCIQTIKSRLVVKCCAVWNDGRYLLSGHHAKCMKVWERQRYGKYKCIQTLQGHSDAVTCCAVWNDGRYLLSSSDDETLKVWERQSDGKYQCIQTLQGHSNYVYCCAVWNDGRHLLSGSWDKTLKVWERQSDGQYQCIQTLEGHSIPVTCCAVWNDGRHLLSGSHDKTLKVWERQSDGQYHCFQTLQGHSIPVHCCAVWNDGRHLLSGSWDYTLKVWERQSDSQYHCIQTLKGHSNGVDCSAVSANGQHLVSGSNDKTLKVWKLEPQVGDKNKTSGEGSSSVSKDGIVAVPDQNEQGRGTQQAE